MNHKLSIILSLACEKKVAGRDILVLLACVHFTDWKTGRSRVTTKKISELLGTAQPNVRGSLRKLKACGLIVDAEDRDGTLYMIPHPKIFECSSGKVRGLLLKNYYEGVYGKDNAASIKDEEMEWLNAKDSTTNITPSPAGDDLGDFGGDCWAEDPINDEEMEWLNGKGLTIDIASSRAGDDLDNLEDDSWAEEL